MKTIIAGSREINDFALVEEAIKLSNFKITTVVSGGARGVDSLGEWYANKNNLEIDRYLPEWNKFGRGAGHIRNELMAKNADALVDIWDGKSPGTKKYD